MALRHKSKRKPLFSLDALTGEPEGRLLAEEVIRTEERNRILHFCMDEMNPDYREVLYLTYFEGMSYAQAAEVTGKTVKQITNMVYRGKRKPAKAAGTGGNHKCGVMRSASRRRSGASPKWNGRSGCGAIRSPWLPWWRRALCCSSARPSPCPALPRKSRQAIMRALKRRQVCTAAARPLGYIVIGLLAFLLGVCVTVLCFRLRQMSREDGQDRKSEGCAWS